MSMTNSDSYQDYIALSPVERMRARLVELSQVINAAEMTLLRGTGGADGTKEGPTPGPVTPMSDPSGNTGQQNIARQGFSEATESFDPSEARTAADTIELNHAEIARLAGFLHLTPLELGEIITHAKEHRAPKS